MRIDVLTLFPKMFESPFAESIVARARSAGRLELGFHDLRAWATDRHRTVDDIPYGGGAGMVFTPEPLTPAIREVRGRDGHVVLLSAQGRLFDEAVARRLASLEHLVLVAGHYEGVDERSRDVVEELGLLAHRATGGTSASGMPLRTRSERAVAVGFAPFLIQWRTRSPLRTRLLSSRRGS